MQKYTVLRQHIGDRDYLPGETREARPADVAHLVGTVLEPIEAKVAEAPEDKATEAPENKGRKSK